MHSTLPKVGFKQWEIWLYYSHDNHDKTPDIGGGVIWSDVTDLPLGLRLVKPGSAPDNLNVFPEKLFVVARFEVGWPGGTVNVGYFIGDEVEPRLVLETSSPAYVNLNGTMDISDIFPMTDEVQMADLHVMYRAFGGGVYLAYHQVYYCVRR